MNKHFAILPDGRKVTRNSKTRVYTHMLTGWDESRQMWLDLGWSGSLQLAVKNRDKHETLIAKHPTCDFARSVSKIQIMEAQRA